MLGRLKAVVQSIANHVRKRLGHAVENIAVYFNIPADHFQLRLLNELSGHLPDLMT